MPKIDIQNVNEIQIPIDEKGKANMDGMIFIDSEGNQFNESELFTQDDPVNHPSHYTAGGIECIDAIAAALGAHHDPVAAWLTGQCLKYLWRWPLKNGVEDLKKTRFYLDRLIELVE